MSDRKLNRRQFLSLSATAALGAAAAACARTSEVVEVTREIEKQVEVTKVVEVEKKAPEPPALASQVAAGELPALDARLPQSPMVIGGRDGIGVYGGEIRQIHFDTVWSTDTYDWMSDRVMQYSDADFRTLVPNMFESWEASSDGTTYTLYMRKGMKWSDGADLTTEDVDFWWNKWAIAEDMESWGPAQPFNGIQNKRCTLEIVDDYTFRCTFDYTFGLFPHILTRNMGGYPSEGPFMPAHFLKNYHLDYAGKEALDKLMSEWAMERWQQVMNRFCNQWGLNTWQFPDWAKDFPTLAAWIPKEYPAEGLIIFERNPYYWKVDLVGNQLPYIDTLRLDYMADTQTMELKLIGGELDWLGMHDVTIAKYPLYKENEDKGKYVVGDYLSCMTDRYTLYPRRTLPKDPVLEEIVNHPSWTRALSVAIDREEINQSLFYGLARMGQMAPMPNSKYFKEKYGTAWAQYDPALANQLLDEMGLEKGSDGIRLRPDGKRLSYMIEHAGIRVGASVAEFTEMVCTFWREIGIDATTKQIDESLYGERMNANEVECGIWHADRCTDMLLPIQMQWYVPVADGQQGGVSRAWQDWYTAVDKEAEGLITPPEEIQQLYAWVDEMRAVIDDDERVSIGQKIFDYLADKPLSLGIVLESPCPVMYNKNMRNMPRPKVPIGWDTYGINSYQPCAFYYEGGQRA
ncbi:MAG: ABC transporter substrate-binding protein [Anaerolineae bacterium]|nr:ABC transporter substrate-binding protein [Anaerolineae bacterium]